MNDAPKTNRQEIIFSEETNFIIEQILEKYRLKEKQEKELQKLVNSKLSTEKLETFENLPASKISILLRECAEGHVTKEELPLILENKLSVSRKEAEEIAKELKEKILNHLGEIKKEGALVYNIEKESSLETQEKSEIALKEDNYREPIG